MKRYSIDDNYIYLNEHNGNFSLIETDNSLFDDNRIKNAPNYSTSLYSCVTFCLEISNSCNLNCLYCFNKNKNGDRMTWATAKASLDYLFETYNDSEKYYIDLSGNGEPLLNNGLIFKIANYAKTKSDLIDKEVTVTLVTNGTLLSKEKAIELQNNSLLFGVSLDGSKDNHDLFRVDKTGCKTYDLIVRNVLSVENRTYVGVATTITNRVFPLLDTILELSKCFNTISIKPVRSKTYGLDSNSLENWKSEYSKLEKYLEDKALSGDTSILFKLLNGDDYFGKFILRCFLNLRALSRCDAGCGRIVVGIDGKLYPCPALTKDKYCLGDVFDTGLDKVSAEKLYNKIVERVGCKDCDFIYYCGGECLAEKDDFVPNKIMCAFKKHLILLSMLFEEKCRIYSKETYSRIINFCLDKWNRNRENKELRLFRNQHLDLSFTKAKLLFDKMFPKY